MAAQSEELMLQLHNQKVAAVKLRFEPNNLDLSRRQ